MAEKIKPFVHIYIHSMLTKGIFKARVHFSHKNMRAHILMFDRPQMSVSRMGGKTDFYYCIYFTTAF